MPQVNRNASRPSDAWLHPARIGNLIRFPAGIALLVLLGTTAAFAQTVNRPSQILSIRSAFDPPTHDPGTSRKQILGTVIEQRKYSIRVASGEEDYELVLPDGIPIDQRLDRPQLDFATGLLTQELIASQAEDAEPGQQVTIKEPFPQPLGLEAEFAHQNERRRLLERDPKQVVRYRLLPLEQLARRSPGELELVAEVRPSHQPGKVRLEADGQSHEVQLGSRDARLGGRTIADLKPLLTEVEVEAEWIDNRWVAQAVLYRRIHRPSPSELPRLLLLGDEVSLSYLSSLRQQLAGKFSVYHPPENCRGSSQWQRLPLWLGPYRQAGHHWDVIVFNFGLADLNTDEESYRAAVRQAASALEPAANRLIWLATTPLPDQWQTAGPGDEELTRATAQAKLDRLNEISREVFAEFPSIKVVELTKRLEAERSGELATWFAGQSAGFTPRQSSLIAAWLAEALPPSDYEDE